jgi:tungstate transport system ATP-binding protein
MSDALYRLEGVQQERDGKITLDIPFLEIERGVMLGLVGPNGSGKSTLLRLLAFLDRPARGDIFFEGRLAQDHAALRREATLLLQEPYLLKRSVYANVAYGLRVRGGMGKAELQARVDAALRMVGLDPEGFGPRSWRALSGGEAQRVALAARLALKPKVLLLDEPTSSLDEAGCEAAAQAARAAREQWGATVLVVSHDRDWLDALCEQTLRLGQGRLKE